MAKSKITPIFARVLVRPKKEEEKTDSGIVLPDSASKEKPMEGEILQIGEKCKVLKKGDKVIFKKYSPTEIKVDGEELFILEEEDILGKIS